MVVVMKATAMLLGGALLAVGVIAGCGSNDAEPRPATASPSAGSTSTPPSSSTAPDSTPPPADADWPDSLDLATATRGQHNPLSVAWIAVATLGTDDLDAALNPASAELEAVGYDGSQWPLSCQYDAYEALGVTDGPSTEFGVGVVFTTHADAVAFDELWTGSMLGIVDGDVFCDLGG